MLSHRIACLVNQAIEVMESDRQTTGASFGKQRALRNDKRHDADIDINLETSLFNSKDTSDTSPRVRLIIA